MKFYKLLVLTTLTMATTMLVASQCPADIIVTIPNVSVAPGGSGFLDVFISSDGTDAFQNYSLDFRVSGPAQATDPINFVESVTFGTPAPQLAATGPDYIFLGDSAEAAFSIGIDFVSDSPGSPVANDQINVMDGTDSLADRTIALADGNFLLARLNFVAPLSATPGSVYDVSLDFGDFQDSTFMSRDFSSNVGSITISAAAVPEPSSFAVLGCGVGCLLIHRRKKRRSAHNLTE